MENGYLFSSNGEYYMSSFSGFSGCPDLVVDGRYLAPVIDGRCPAPVVNGKSQEQVIDDRCPARGVDGRCTAPVVDVQLRW